MVVSIFFSVGIYLILHRELQRNERRMRFRMEVMRESHPEIGTGFVPRRNMAEMTERAIALNLFEINLIILAVSSLAGYFLAGRTLRPIRSMVDSQNQFVADASHELRTPLTALRTAIEVNLRDRNMNLKQARTVLEENLDDVNKLHRLSEHLLALASFKTNGYQHEKIDLQEIVKKSVQSVSYQAREKKIVIKVRTESVKTEGDGKKLADALVIFLDNAVKYSAAGTTITVTLKKTDGQAVISVKDEGAGIEKKDISRIFERFYRADTSRSHAAASGYGLGLAIARDIIGAHSGTIQVESKPGHGTTFTIALPVKKKK
jgi:signal transduction histidine kinase